MENRLEPSIFFPQIHLKRDLCTPIAVQRSLYTEQTEPQTRKETRIRHSVRVLLTGFTIVVALIAGICSPKNQSHSYKKDYYLCTERKVAQTT